MQDQAELTRLLVRIADLRDPNAERHSEGVAELTAELARRIDMDVEDRKVLGHAAKLHDIGKVAMSDSVMNKPSRLTRAEYLMVQQHTILGYQLLQPMKIDPVITGAILSHHENFDGSGYPEGLKGEAIPLAARLIRVADFYDALVSHRSYRDSSAYGAVEALSVLQENRHCFDPSLFSTFVEMIMERS